MSSRAKKKRADAEAKVDLVYRTWLELLSGTKYYKKYMDIMVMGTEKCILYGDDFGERWTRNEMSRVFNEETMVEIVSDWKKRNGNIELNENT